MLVRWRAVGPAGARRGLLASVAATLALLGLYRTPVGPRPLPSRPAPPVRGGRGLPHSQQLWNQCRNVLLMSQLQFPWERGDRHQRCKKAQWSVAEALEGVRKLQQSRPDRRAVRIVFIGDSRVRNLHSTLVKELGLRPDNASTVPMFYNEVFHPREQLRRAVPPQPRLPGLRAGCTEVDVMRPDGQDRVRCSLAAGAASLRSEFWWRPYLERRSAALLDSLIAACEAGRCPDLVVIDSGPWYARVARYRGDPTTERVFVFRAELAAAAGRLARLADATRLLWKLDEQYMPEVAYGRKMNVTGAMMVLSSVVHETAARIPRLSAWSSGLAETTHFYHQVCLPHGRQLRQFTVSPVRYECLDPMHVGHTVRWKMIQTLFNVLFFNVVSPTQGLCCGA